MIGEKNSLIVAEIMQNYSPGGVATHLYNLISSLAGFQFVLFAKPGKWRTLYEKVPSVLSINEKWPSLKEIESAGCALAHFHAIRPLFVALLKDKFNPSERKIPIVVTLHGLPIRKFMIKKGIFWRIAFSIKRFYEGWSVRHADIVICVSEADKNFAIEHFGVPKERIRIVYYGIPFIDTNILIGERVELRKEFNIEQDTYVFVVPARFHEQKGLDVLAKALLELRDSLLSRRVLFVFLGDGPLFEDIQNQIGHLPYVRLEGVVLPENMPKWWAMADAMILPSRWEGLPISLIEAGLFKVSPIASDIPGNNEIVFHQKTGLLFEMDNVEELKERIIYALENRSEMKQFAENLHNLVISRHSVEQMAEQIKKIYEELLHRAD